MYKGVIPAGTVMQDGKNIPTVTAFNTNNNVRYNAETYEIEFLKPGYYDVAVTLPITNSSVSTISMAIASGYDITTVGNDITATTGVRTLSLTDTIHVERSPYDEMVTLSLRLYGGNATAYRAGNITVERRA